MITIPELNELEAHFAGLNFDIVPFYDVLKKIKDTQKRQQLFIALQIIGNGIDLLELVFQGMREKIYEESVK